MFLKKFIFFWHPCLPALTQSSDIFFCKIDLSIENLWKKLGFKLSTLSLCTRIDAIFRTFLCNNDLSISKLFYSFQNFIFCHRYCVLTLIRPTEDFLCENDCSWWIFLEKLSFCFWSSLLGTAIDTFSRKQLCKNDTSWNFFF